MMEAGLAKYDNKRPDAEYSVIHDPNAGRWATVLEGKRRHLISVHGTEAEAWEAVRELKRGDDEVWARISGEQRRYQS